MNRARSSRVRYRRPSRPAPSRRFRPGWILAAAVVGAVGLGLAYPVVHPDLLEGSALAVLALVPPVVALTMRPGAGRGRMIGSLAAIVVVLGGYSALLYTARFAPHAGYSVSITGGASLSQVEGEIRALASKHALAADTSFSSDRIKVDFPNGDPGAVAATIGELRRAPGVASVEGCRGTLC